MKRIILCLAIFIFLFKPGLKAEEITLTLDEAVALALRSNPDVSLKTEDVKKAKAKIKEARAGLLPSLNLSAGWQDTRELLAKDIGTYSTHAGVTQILYASGKVINAVKVSEYNYIASQAVLDKTKLETVLNVKKAFYALILANKFVEINKWIVENTKEHADLIQARFGQGESSESDMIKMRYALLDVQQAYEASVNQAEAAGALLNNLLFFDKEVRIKAIDPLTYEPKEIAFDEAFLKAMQNRPEIRQFEAQQKQAEKAVTIAKAGGRPTILASWDYYSSSRLSVGGLAAPGGKGWNDYNVLGVTVSWPIFDGWLTKSKVDQALIDLKESQLLKDKTAKDIALEVKTSYLDLKNAIEKIKSTGEQVVVFKDNLSVFQEKYKVGLVSLLDLHDAELSYAVALFNQIQTHYDYIVAKARFDKATGG
jgi:outer membrane protein